MARGSGAGQAEAPTKTAEPEFLAEMRRRASEAFATLPMPIRKDKGWGYTDLSDLDLDAYAPAGPGDLEAEPDSTAPIDGTDLPEVIQVDATVDVRRADPKRLPERVVIAPLAEAVETHAELVAPHLGTLVLGGDKFAAQNSASWQGGAFVYVPPGVHLEAPIVFTALQTQPHTAIFWRSLIVLAEGASATIEEQYLSADRVLDSYFSAGAELIVGEGARLNYMSIQELSESSWIFASHRARVEWNGDIHWVALGLGSANGKVRMETDLRGRGANGRVTGAYVGRGTQHLDFDTTQEHFAPDTTSDLAFRGILTDRATAAWSGMIRVEPDAQRTDAFQESRNLLLSESAHADAIPGLEIEANDVRCTHAATLGKVDEQQIFYLMSRGLTRTEAVRLLVSGFFEALTSRLDEAGELRKSAATAALERKLREVLG